MTQKRECEREGYCCPILLRSAVSSVVFKWTCHKLPLIAFEVEKESWGGGEGERVNKLFGMYLNLKLLAGHVQDSLNY